MTAQVEGIADPRGLWLMSPEDFNEWRATNDLQSLYAFFEARLPGFKEWLDNSHLDRERFCRVVPTADLFLGGPIRSLYRNRDFYPHREIYSTLESSVEDTKEIYRGRGTSPPPDLVEFEPYFRWAERTLKSKRYFRTRIEQPQRTDTFEYTEWRAFNNPSMSRAILLGSHTVAKLGAVTLVEGIRIGMRNLDFADLDFLQVQGKYHGSTADRISFSTCRSWNIENAELNFATFHRCEMEGFRCASTTLHKFTFSECRGFDRRFERSRLRQISFEHGTMPFDFDDCDLIDVKFDPPKNVSHLAAADGFRRLRFAYQSTGRRDEAAACYYQERLHHMRALWNPYMDYRSAFPLYRYGGRLKDVWTYFEKGDFTRDQSIKLALSIPVFHLKVWLFPKYAFRALTFKLKYFVSLLEWAVWGFGERPVRVFGTALLIIAAYASVYARFADALLAQGAGNPTVRAIYFSLITFTTLGYGDILPATDWMRMVCGSEALLGGFTMGLVVAGFANRSRY